MALIAIAMSLYHMHAAAFGPPEALIFRGTHLLFALTLVFLLFPSRPGGGMGWRALDAVLMLAGWGIVLHIFFNYQYFMSRIIYIDELTTWDKVWATAAVLVVLEGTRRVLGWALPLTAVCFLAYVLFFTQVQIPVLMEQLYLSTEGIFGSTLGVSASYVMMFVLFGAFMEKSGTGQLFMDFSMSITGRYAGGPGKVAVVSSSLFGTVSGSAVANVMVDGPITIPLMKRTGFRPAFAAAVESVASTGGQLMPPIMGAAAFVMAEFLAVPYAQITVWAILPAFLYYLAVFSAVHFEAKRYKLAGVPASELPRFGDVMLTRGHLFIPILIVLTGLIQGYSAPLCALVGALSCLPLALLKRATRAAITWTSVLEALEEGAKNTLAVAMACACAGIVIACVTITGLGIVFTQIVVALSQDTLIRHGGNRARHGNADDARVHHDGRAPRAGADQARHLRLPGTGHAGMQGGRDAGSAHVRLLLRDPFGDHPAGGARRVRRGEPRQGQHVASRLRRHARRRACVHRALHVRLRADAAAHRQGLERRLGLRRVVGDQRVGRRGMPRREPLRLALHPRPRLASGPALRRCALPHQARPDHRRDRPWSARHRDSGAAYCPSSSRRDVAGDLMVNPENATASRWTR